MSFLTPAHRLSDTPTHHTPVHQSHHFQVEGQHPAVLHQKQFLPPNDPTALNKSVTDKLVSTEDRKKTGSHINKSEITSL